MDNITIRFFPFPFLIGLLVLALLLAFFWLRKRRMAYLSCLALFGVYLLMVLRVVFFPIRIPENWISSITPQTILWTLSRINFVPLKYGRTFRFSRRIIIWELAGNILLTMPLGFLLPFLVRIPPRWIIWIALGTGLALETTQLMFELLGFTAGYPHAIDISDVITNATGVLVGYGLNRLVSWLSLQIKMAVLPQPSTNEDKE